MCSMNMQRADTSTDGLLPYFSMASAHAMYILPSAVYLKSHSGVKQASQGPLNCLRRRSWMIAWTAR